MVCEQQPPCEYGLLLAGLVVALVVLAFVTWGWATERGIRVGLIKALDIERESYRMLVAHFNEKTVGASMKHVTVRFEQEHQREQAKHPTTRIPLLTIPPGKRTPRH